MKAKLGQGQQLSTNKQKRRKQLFAKAVSFYRQYPDRFAEEVLEIPLNLYQKVLLRAFFRFKYSMWVLSRGLGKTFLGALALCIYGLLYRGTSIGIIAPSFRQSKLVIEDKIVKELLDKSPFLKSEVKRVILSQAEARVEFWNGSRILAVPTGDGNKIRGYRFHLILADEYAQIKKEILDLVVNPMMNVRRGYEVGKEEYDDSVGNRVLITSSAYYRHNHLYPEFMQYVDEMRKGNPKYFVCTLPYQVGIQVKLFDDDHIAKEKKRLSPMDFRMEYECVFPNMSENAWISFQDLEDCSVLNHIETKGIKGYTYIMGLDVARVEGQDNTIAQVLKLVPRRGGRIERHLVYTLSMNGEKFSEQCKQIRELLKKFPEIYRIYMDTQTIGMGLYDELSKEYFDIEEQKLYCPLIDLNNEEDVTNITTGIPIIYGIKPSAESNHRAGMAVKTATQRKTLQMYSREAGDDKYIEKKLGKDDMLVFTTDQAKEYFSTSDRLTLDEERQVLEAEQTRREVLSIEAKPSGMYFKFEPSVKSHRKDRWSALSYALLGAEIYEQELNKDEDEILVGAVGSR